MQLHSCQGLKNNPEPLNLTDCPSKKELFVVGTTAVVSLLMSGRLSWAVQGTGVDK